MANKRLRGNKRQKDQGTWATLLVYDMLLEAGLPVELVGFMSNNSDEATNGDIAAYLPFMESVFGKERFAELSPIDLKTPDIALRPEGKPPVALIEVTSIKWINQGRYHTLPTDRKDIAQFLPSEGNKPRYYEPGYIAYVIADGDHYTLPPGHTPRPVVFWGKPEASWLEDHEYKFSLGGYRCNVPYNPYGEGFADNNSKLLADELRKYLD